MPTINQLVRKPRKIAIKKSKSPALGKIHNAAWRVSRRNPKGRCRKGGQGVAVVVLQQHGFCPFSFRRPWGFGAV